MYILFGVWKIKVYLFVYNYFYIEVVCFDFNMLYLMGWVFVLGFMGNEMLFL